MYVIKNVYNINVSVNECMVCKCTHKQTRKARKEHMDVQRTNAQTINISCPEDHLRIKEHNNEQHITWQLNSDKVHVQLRRPSVNSNPWQSQTSRHLHLAPPPPEKLKTEK